jgi:hypothetical protein
MKPYLLVIENHHPANSLNLLLSLCLHVLFDIHNRLFRVNKNRPCFEDVELGINQAYMHTDWLVTATHIELKICIKDHG